MSAARVGFEMSFSGDHTIYHGMEITTIDVKVQGVSRKICASINQAVTPKEHLLQFMLRDNTGNPIHDKHSESTVGRISLVPEKAKTIQLSARVFEHYEDRSVLTMHPNGRVTGQMRARRQDLDISTPANPAFEPGKIYRIRVINQGDRLSASFEVVQEMPQAPQAHEAAVRMVEEGLRNLTAGLGATPADLGQSLQNLVGALQEGDSHPELDALTVPELRTRFAQAEAELEEARTQFNQAIDSHNDSRILQALDHKQACLLETQRVLAALTRKGVQLHVQQ